MLFLLSFQGPGIELYKLALKLDTLTTDPLGTIYTSEDLIKHLKEASTAVCGQSLFSAASLYDILFNYRGIANCIVISLKCPL